MEQHQAPRSEDLDLFFTLSPDLLCMADFDGRFVALNPAWEYTLGYSTVDLLKVPYLDFVHPDDRERTFEETSQLTRQADSRTFLNRYRCKDGSYKWLRWSATSNLSRRRIYAIARDITHVRKLQDELYDLNATLEERVRIRTDQWRRANESLRDEVSARVRTEEALRRAYQTLSSIFAASPHAIIAVDVQRNVRLWNPAATRIFGWTEEEVVGGRVPFVTNETREESNRFNERALKGEAFTNFEVRRHRRDGTPIDLLVSAAPTYDMNNVIDGFLTVATDVTEHKKLEQQLLRTQRLESLGTLAGGIAHDLNNVLSPIVMALELFRMKSTDPTMLRTLDSLDACAKRGIDLIRQVLTFARGVQGERVALQVRHVLQDLEKILIHTMPKSITIHTNVPRDLWVVSGDVTQLHQVLMNLAVNARDAMPAGGFLTITAQNIVLDETNVALNPGASAGPHIMIEMQDTGHGIPADVKDKIFQPFFTTKEIGKGTGLGLSTVAAILKNHGGFINFYSEVGRGTSFKVYLPALPGQEDQTTEKNKQAPPVGNGETILIVDDESAIRDIAKLALEAHGYRVIVARDGAEGVAMYARHSDEIRLVISDMEMPVLNGDAMMRFLERIDPQIRVISSSGLASNAPSTVTPFRAVLPKPYTIEQLLRTVHQAILPQPSSERLAG